jgi:putative drug exporter of the RND superfamily
VTSALADLAGRRPWALLAANLAVLAVGLALALGAPEHLGIGSLALSEGSGRASSGGGAGPRADLVIATTGQEPASSGVYRVALRVISSQVRTDATVSAIRQGPISANGRSTSLLVSLAAADRADRQQAVERIEDGIDPGPLRVAFGGELGALLEARHDLSGDLWKLELLALPFVLLALAAAVGPRLAAAPVICAATAVVGALAGLRVVGGFADLSLLGIAPAAVVGVGLGVEAPCLLISRFRDESTLSQSDEALRQTVAAGGRIALSLGVAATAATVGLLVTPLDQAPSMVLACALAAGFALASSLVCVPPLLVLAGRAKVGAGEQARGESSLERASGTLAGLIARSPLRTALASLVAVAALVGAALPILQADSRPFSAADLPAKSQAAKAAAIAGGGGGQDAGGGVAQAARPAGKAPNAHAQSLFPKLILAAAVSAAALLLVFGVGFGSIRFVPVAIVTLLPAAAACGLCVLVFQEGHLAAAIGQQRQAALETGAVASLLAGIGSVSAFRAAVAIDATRDERGLGTPPRMVAETVSGVTLPAAALATLVAGASAGVLAGSDLYSAREFGLAVAAGLLLDLVVLRVPLVAALARWAGKGYG